MRFVDIYGTLFHNEGVTLYELYASEGSAPLYEKLGFAADPALMRMTRFPSTVEGNAS